jgi:aarF domain-containing kinase
VAKEVREHSQVRVARPTTEALCALCYAYFDTRPSPLAEVGRRGSTLPG